jgi:hypothetical protein
LPEQACENQAVDGVVEDTACHGYAENGCAECGMNSAGVAACHNNCAGGRQGQLGQGQGNNAAQNSQGATCAIAAKCAAGAPPPPIVQFSLWRWSGDRRGDR